MKSFQYRDPGKGLAFAREVGLLIISGKRKFVKEIPTLLY